MEDSYIQDQIKILDQRIKETEELLSDPQMKDLAAAEIEDLKKTKGSS